MRINPPTKIYLDKSPIHGLGVFASEDIKENEIFEITPILDLPIAKGEVSGLFLDYRFNWPSGLEFDKQVLAMGFGEFYNHSNTPNAYWRSNFDMNCFEFYAIKDIKAGEEICTYYGDVNYWNDGRTHVEVK